MNEVIDIRGASGEAYRFRLQSEDRPLPATAGNFVYVRAEGEGFALICCGETHSLIHARRLWPHAVSEHQATHLYLRLNVARVRRHEECADIVARHQPVMTSCEADW